MDTRSRTKRNVETGTSDIESDAEGKYEDPAVVMTNTPKVDPSPKSSDREGEAPRMPARDIPDQTSRRFDSLESRLGRIENLMRQLVDRQDTRRSQETLRGSKEPRPSPSHETLVSYGPGDSGAQTVVLNQINPEQYYGDQAGARSWLRQYQAVIRVNEYGDGQKLMRAIAYLRRPAQSWYSVTLASVVP